MYLVLFLTRQDKHKNISEILDDKSEIEKCREIYEKYNIVDSYDDEYDDTYDSHNIGVLDDSTEIDARSFTIPRVSLNILFLSSILPICKFCFLCKFFFYLDTLCI